jgi:16S rRNA (cytosine967-C5)-methyltransferase
MNLFRKNHLFTILHNYEQGRWPLDGFLSRYFRAHRSVGSKDRQQISDTIYELIRWKGRLDHLCEKPSWENRLEAFAQLSQTDDSNLPPHVSLSFPKPYFDLLTEAHGLEKTKQFCAVSNQRAPLTVRVNLLKISREELLSRWTDHYQVSPCRHSPCGIQFQQKINLFGLPEFKEGLFEVQDEGSQLIAQMVRAQPKDQVLDFCTGAGGKALAIAPVLKNTGQIHIHDIREKALQEAFKRLNRAGVQNVQQLSAKSAQKMDWILVDAPCTGSGTLRRNPDLKWRFSLSGLNDLIEQQRQIFQEAVCFLKPKGTIVYSTCSVLPQENQQQIDHFIKMFNLKLAEPVFQSFPEAGGMDGFFGAALQRN